MDLDCEVEVEAIGKRITAHINEMSVGGCFVETPDCDAFGSPVRLSFQLDNAPRALKVNGIVRWVSKKGFGVQFLALGVAAVYSLTEYLAKKQPATLPPPKPGVRRPPVRPKKPPIDGAEVRKRWEALRKRDRRYAEAKRALKVSESQAPPADDEHRKLRDALEKRQQEVEVARKSLLQREEQLAGATDDLERHREQVAGLVAAQERLERELVDLRTTLAARDEQLALVKTMLDDRVQQVALLRDELQERDEEPVEVEPDNLDSLPPEALGTMLLERDAQLGQLQDVAVQLQRELAECLKERDELREQIASADDLTRIRGIGPKFARALRGAGITRFEQIASWTDESVDEIAGYLGTSASRIRSIGWVESAGALVAQREQ